MEGSAAAADQGGPIAACKGRFAGLPPEAYAGAMEKSGVSPAARGSGYILFFLYSAAIGVVGSVLAFAVARRQGEAAAPAQGAESEPAG